jgi:hypothetical protein
MTLDEIRPHLQQLSDADVLTLLMEVSDEVKRRNTIMQGILGADPPQTQKETIQKGFQALVDALSGKNRT